jgi:phosphohistidine phosphatase
LKEIILLRHAKSSRDEPALADFERPLSGRGKRACAAVATAVRRLAPAPRLVLASPARRTAETLERIEDALPAGAEVALEKALYLASASKLLERLRRLDDAVPSVMVIGHNPGLQRLALLIAGRGDKSALEKLAAKFPTAALAVLRYPGARWRELAADAAELLELWSPKDE